MRSRSSGLAPGSRVPGGGPGDHYYLPVSPTLNPGRRRHAPGASLSVGSPRGPGAAQRLSASVVDSGSYRRLDHPAPAGRSGWRPGRHRPGTTGALKFCGRNLATRCSTPPFLRVPGTTPITDFARRVVRVLKKGLRRREREAGGRRLACYSTLSVSLVDKQERVGYTDDIFRSAADIGRTNS